jgi:hypothetical protein
MGQIPIFKETLQKFGPLNDFPGFFVLTSHDNKMDKFIFFLEIRVYQDGYRKCVDLKNANLLVPGYLSDNASFSKTLIFQRQKCRFYNNFT